MNALIQALKPSQQELEQIALRETDPRFYGAFEPFTNGPLFAVCVLAFVAICSIVAIPWRLLKLAMGPK